MTRYSRVSPEEWAQRWQAIAPRWQRGFTCKMIADHIGTKTGMISNWLTKGRKLKIDSIITADRVRANREKKNKPQLATRTQRLIDRVQEEFGMDGYEVSKRNMAHFYADEMAAHLKYEDVDKATVSVLRRYGLVPEGKSWGQKRKHHRMRNG